MRWFVRVLALLLLGFLGLVILGPRLPEGFFLRDVAIDLRDVMNAWWGFPLGPP